MLKEIDWRITSVPGAPIFDAVGKNLKWHDVHVRSLSFLGCQTNQTYSARSSCSTTRWFAWSCNSFEVNPIYREDHKFYGISSQFNPFHNVLSQTSQKVILDLAPVKNSRSRNNKYTNVKIIFLRTFCNKSDMFRFIVIFFRELKSINKAYVK
jgi:hypothetical protein